MFVSVRELRDPSSADVLNDLLFPGDAWTEKRGVEYGEHRKSLVAGHPAVRARFRSFGDQVNWGIEYAVRKQNRVLHIYISRPDPETENLFEKMVATLQW